MQEKNSRSISIMATELPSDPRLVEDIMQYKLTILRFDPGTPRGCTIHLGDIVIGTGEVTEKMRALSFKDSAELFEATICGELEQLRSEREDIRTGDVFRGGSHIFLAEKDGLFITWEKHLKNLGYDHNARTISQLLMMNASSIERRVRAGAPLEKLEPLFAAMRRDCAVLDLLTASMAPEDDGPVGAMGPPPLPGRGLNWDQT